MVWRLSHITIDELPVARVLDEVAYLRHGPAHDTADMRRQEQRLTAQEKDRAYFRETREKRLGATLEAVSVNRETDVLTFRKTLEPVRAVLAAQPYFGGERPPTGIMRCSDVSNGRGASALFRCCAKTIRSGFGVIGCSPRVTGLRAKRLAIQGDRGRGSWSS